MRLQTNHSQQMLKLGDLGLKTKQFISSLFTIRVGNHEEKANFFNAFEH